MITFASSSLVFYLLLNGFPNTLAIGYIEPGVGYSKDSQQMAPHKCYKGFNKSISDKIIKFNLQAAASFADLENILGVDTSIKGSYEIFSADGKANYLSSVKDEDDALSLNYYASVSNEVTVEFEGVGRKALTPIGKKNYRNNFKYFGLLCGDEYVISYRQGGIFIVSFNIKFSSRDGKKTVRAEVNGNYGSLEQILGRIQSICNEKGIYASIVIKAYQFGGENKLGKSISAENIVKCDIKRIEKCQEAATKFLAYAQNFEEQFKDNKNFNPMNVVRRFPIIGLELTPPKSLVTSEIEKYRKELSDELMKNKYYIKKLESYYNELPSVPKSKLSVDLIEKVKMYLDRAKSNINVLTNKGIGAVRCFDVPQECKETKDRINALLQDIPADEIKSLPNSISNILFEEMKRTNKRIPISLLTKVLLTFG